MTNDIDVKIFHASLRAKEIRDKDEYALVWCEHVFIDKAHVRCSRDCWSGSRVFDSRSENGGRIARRVYVRELLFRDDGIVRFFPSAKQSYRELSRRNIFHGDSVRRAGDIVVFYFFFFFFFTPRTFSHYRFLFSVPPISRFPSFHQRVPSNNFIVARSVLLLC